MNGQGDLRIVLTHCGCICVSVDHGYRPSVGYICMCKLEEGVVELMGYLRWVKPKYQ